MFLQFVIALCILGYVHSRFAEYCPYNQCLDKKEGRERWDCIGKKLYEPLPDGVAPLDSYYVQHDCHRVGWGNSVRGFYVTSAVAMLTGRRLSLYHPQFNRMFDPPTEGMKEWDYGVMSSLDNKTSEGKIKDIETKWWEIQDNYVQHWNYEYHDEWVNNWKIWTNVNEHTHDNDLEKLYTKPIIASGMCGGSINYIKDIECIKNILPLYYKCIHHNDYQLKQGYTENSMSALFSYMAFKRPSTKMIEYIKIIRKNIGLPTLPSGLEEIPGQWGIRTPGYYILAVHYRNIPIGFEPVAIELRQTKSQHEYKTAISTGFWQHIKQSAIEAKKIATCRNEKLLIYVATDDPYNIREKAKDYLKEYGDVVFGLDANDVGHMNPGWEDHTEKALLESISKKTVKGINAALHSPQPDEGDLPYTEAERGLDHLDSLESLQPDDPNATGGLPDDYQPNEHGDIPLHPDTHLPYDPNAADSNDQNPEDTIDFAAKHLSDSDEYTYHKGERSTEATARHGDWSIAEWFVLSNAHWLIGHSGSSFAETASTLGLSPSGVMERYDMIHGEGHVHITNRIDWDDDQCTHVYAADPKHRETCPNSNEKEVDDEDEPMTEEL